MGIEISKSLFQSFLNLGPAVPWSPVCLANRIFFKRLFNFYFLEIL